MIKTILITGATDGIGLDTARRLMLSGHTILVHGRNKTKASRASDSLNNLSKGKAIPVWGDLSFMDQVLNLADQVISASPQLNILINNAGVYLKDREITSDGFEKTMAINHFATHLLTKKLLDRIEISKNSRIINVSSIAHEGTGLDLENMEFEDNFSGYKAYATSKLANILFTKSLSSRLRGNTTANCLHPGVISTKLLHAGFNIKGAPTSKGSVTSVYLSESEHLNGIQGRYFINCKETNPSKIARDKTLAEELWHITEERLSKFL